MPTPTATTTETITVEKTVKKTYPQDWPNYNAAQTKERRLFRTLLKNLCDLIPEPEAVKKPKGGRPATAVRDLFYAAILIPEKEIALAIFIRLAASHD